MEASERLARRRLAVLRLADRLDNVAEACRRSGVDRTSFYEWKRRFSREGVAGLHNRAPVHRSHPHATPADVGRQIAAFAWANPAHGCDRIARELARRGVEVSAVTIQKILHKVKLGTYESRGAALEACYAHGSKLSAGQIVFLESINPCFRERRTALARPGELLCHGTFFLGRFEGVGSVYVHALIDGYSSYAFAAVALSSGIEPTLAVLEGQALPFFAAKRIGVEAVLTGALGEASRHALRKRLSSRGVEHRVCEAGRSNGFVERFRRIAVAEFLRRPFVRGSSRAGLPRLQRELDDWLVSYNVTRRHDGYPNYGASPHSIATQEGKWRSR